MGENLKQALLDVNTMNTTKERNNIMPVIQFPIDERHFARLEKYAKSKNLSYQEVLAQAVKAKLDSEEGIKAKKDE